MSDCILEAHSTQLWHELVREAESRSGHALDEMVESYLVFTLMRYTRDAGLLGHVLALDFLESMDRPDRQASEELRDVGDRCLIVAGLYPQQATRRRVSVGYFRELGVAAYREAAERVRAGLGDLYRELSAAFARLVEVLARVRLTESAPLLELAHVAADVPDMQSREADAGSRILVPGSHRRH